MNATAEQLVDLMDELQLLVYQLDTVPVREESMARFRAEARRLQERAQRLASSLSHGADTLRNHLDRMANELRKIQPTVLASTPGQARLLQIRLSQAYEGLALAVRSSPRMSEVKGRVESLRTRNFSRNILHAAMGLSGVFVYEFLLDKTGCLLIVLGILACYAFIDVTRRIWPSLNELYIDRIFSAIARPSERYKIPSSTWYALGVLMVLLVSDQTIAQVSVLVLSLSDPAAMIIGQRLGRHKIRKRKTLEGSAAFLLVAFVSVVAFTMAIKGMGWQVAFSMGAVAGLSGAVGELFCTDRLDDNLLIPICVALALNPLF